MAELAQKIRAKFPGAYDNKPDAELEAAWLRKYPGVARYEQIADPAVVQKAKAPEPSMLQSAMAGPGQAVDRLLGAVVPGEAGKRLAANEATAGQELAKAFVPGYEAPVTPTEIAAGIVQPHVGAAMALGGLGHGRALQKATVEFAGDALRDPYTWGALGALKRLGLVGKGLTAGANAIFALKAGEAVPGEFAEAKRLYDEKGFTPEVTEAIAKGVLLGGAAAMGARGTLKEGAQFGREATAAGGRAVQRVADIPPETFQRVGKTAGTLAGGLGGLLTGGLGDTVAGGMAGRWAGGDIGLALSRAMERFKAQKAGVPTEVVDVPAADLAPGETLRPVPPAAQRPARVPEFSPEAMGLELLSEATSAAPPVEAPAPRTMAEVLVARTPERGWSIKDALDEMRRKDLEKHSPLDWKPGKYPEDAGKTWEDLPHDKALKLADEVDWLRENEKQAEVRVMDLEARGAGERQLATARADAANLKGRLDALLVQYFPDEGMTTQRVVPGAKPKAGPRPEPLREKRGPAMDWTPGKKGVAAPPPEAPPPAPPVEAPALLPEGQRAMPGGRSGTAQSPEIPFKTDNPEAALALQRLLAGDPVEAAPAKAPTSWRQFSSERMGKYMKELGGHGPAVRKIAEEWAAHKAGVPAGATPAKVPPVKAAPAKAPTSVEAELMRLLSELPPPPEGSPTVVRASKRKRASK